MKSLIHFVKVAYSLSVLQKNESIKLQIIQTACNKIFNDSKISFKQNKTKWSTFSQLHQSVKLREVQQKTKFTAGELFLYAKLR